MMEIELSPKIRKTIYIVIVLGTALIVPLNMGGVVSELVMNVWTSLSAAASLLASLNVSKK